ncbi:DUF899 domain-containing protein [Pseudonocardiaceae bacterium YIM PH 21723]|nr:DUF899 domain-containing protein [Pseudonocardiaceae bacterium YIM PH 21723]
MTMPKIVTRAEWQAARDELLISEKKVTRARDAVNAQRRRLPMVPVDRDYTFTGPDGEVGLAGLFAGRRQLYVHHFMWQYGPDRPCPSCSSAADVYWTPKHLALLAEHDVTFVATSNAPWNRIAEVKAERGWDIPWYSSHGTGFGEELGTTVDGADRPANSVFLRDGDQVFHTYTAFERGLDHLYPPYTYIDLTPYGRQEAWEDSPAGWPKR